MTNPIEFIVCRSWPEVDAIGLREFAESFNHTIEAAFPIIVCVAKGKIKGFVHTEQVAIVTPAFHPDKVSPREILMFSKSLSAILSQTYQKWVVQKDFNNRDAFTPEVMGKLGLKKYGFEVYEKA